MASNRGALGCSYEEKQRSYRGDSKNIGMCVLLTPLFGILRKTEGLSSEELRIYGRFRAILPGVVKHMCRQVLEILGNQGIHPGHKLKTKTLILLRPAEVSGWLLVVDRQEKLSQPMRNIKNWLSAVLTHWL